MTVITRRQARRSTARTTPLAATLVVAAAVLTPAHRRLRRIGVLAVIGVILAGGTLAPSFAIRADATVPGTPGTPQPGTPVYTEDFSNQNASLLPISILSYTGGPAAANSTYTAATWYTPAGNQCNGWVMSGTTPTAPLTDLGCLNNPTTTWPTLQQMARTLGTAQGQTTTQALTNQVLTSYTNRADGVIPAGTQFRTVNTIPAKGGHYYAVSAYFAAVNCPAGGPSERFSLIINGVRTTMSSGLNPCVIPGVWETQVAKLQSAAYMVPEGTTPSLGLELYNAAATGNGNDVAFDLPQIIDVTPQLDKAFSPTLIAPNQTSTVTLTVTNTGSAFPTGTIDPASGTPYPPGTIDPGTGNPYPPGTIDPSTRTPYPPGTLNPSSLKAKSDWHITDTLQSGLVIAPNPAVGGTCVQAAGTAALVTTATPGSNVFTLTGGDLVDGQASCTITFDVTAADEGYYYNGPGHINTNLNPPADAILEVWAPRITLTKALDAPREADTDEFTVAIRTGGATGTVVNDTANSTTTGSGSTVTAGTGTTGTYVASADTTYTLTEAASGTGSLTNYKAKITCTDLYGLQPNLPNGAVFDPASPPTIDPVAGAEITCVITNTAQPIMSWDKVVDKGANTLVNPGDTLKYTVSITNSGSVPNPSFTAFDDLTNVVNNATFNTGSITVTPAGGVTASYDPATKHLNVAGPVPANSTITVSYTVTVNSGAFGQLANAFIDKTVVNPIGASLQWRKVDPTPAKNPLAGAEWTLTAQPSGTPLVVTDCIAASATACTGADIDPGAGLFFVKGLTPGNYHLVETKAPVGFVLNSSPILVVVSATTQTTVLADVVNQQQQVPSIPLTGGLGTDYLLITGGGLLALTFGLGGFQFVRRRRTS